MVSRPEEIARYNAEKLGVPQKLVRSPEEAAQDPRPGGAGPPSRPGRRRE